MTTVDPRINAILDWLIQTLNLEVEAFEPASSDASFRRYFRVTHSQGRRHIVMDAPPDKENTEPFIRLAHLFKEARVNVPVIYEQELEQGFLLLEDFGSVCLLDELNDKTASHWYTIAFDSLITLQNNVPMIENSLPLYDEALLGSEINLFYDWFLEQQLNIVIPEAVKLSLNTVLIESALEQPQVCVHRDFIHGI